MQGTCGRVILETTHTILFGGNLRISDRGEGYAGLGEPGFSAGFEAPPGGVVVRQMSEVDLQRILELRTVVRWSADPEAFGLLRGMRDARWAVAEAGDAERSIVGMVGAVPLGHVGVLCHLAVHDAYRRAGLGARLAEWAVAYLRSRGAGVVRLDSTEDAESLYRSMGFEPTLRRVIYRIEDVSGLRNYTRVGGYRVRTLTMSDLPEIYGLDRWYFGGDRSALMLAAIRLHPGRSLAVRDASDRVKGYLVRGAAGVETRIGPFLAESEASAIALLEAALRMIREAGGGPVEVTSTALPGSRERELLTGFGFTGVLDRLRMERRAGPGTQPESQGLSQYGTTSYLAT